MNPKALLVLLLVAVACQEHISLSEGRKQLFDYDVADSPMRMESVAVSVIGCDMMDVSSDLQELALEQIELLQTAKAQRKAHLAFSATCHAEPKSMSVSMFAEVVWMKGPYGIAPSSKLFTQVALTQTDNDIRRIVAAIAKGQQASIDLLYLMDALRLGSAEIVTNAMESVDPRVASWAIQLAQARDSEMFDKAVLSKLESELPDVHLAALEYIRRRKLAGAVERIADKLPLRNTSVVLKAITVVSQLGGPHANGYLEFLSAHSDPIVRQRAKRMLQSKQLR